MKKISKTLSLILGLFMIFGFAAPAMAADAAYEGELFSLDTNDVYGWTTNSDRALVTDYACSVDGGEAQDYVTFVVSGLTDLLYGATPGMNVTTDRYTEVTAEFSIWRHVGTSGASDPDIADAALYYSTDFGATWSAASIPLTATNTGETAEIVGYSGYYGPVYTYTTGNLCDIAPGQVITNFKIVPFTALTTVGAMRLMDFTVSAKGENEIVPEPVLHTGDLYSLNTNDVSGWTTNSDRALITDYSCSVDGGDAEDYVTFVVSGLSDLLYGVTPDMSVTLDNYTEVTARFSIWRHVGTAGAPDPDIANAALYYSTNFGSTWSAASVPLTAVNTGETAEIVGYSGYYGPVYTYTTGNLCDIAPGQVITNFKIVPFTAVATAGAMRLMDFTVSAKGENEIIPEPVPVINDSPVIQALIDNAKAAGQTQVTIPEVNPRDGSSVWVIGEAIELPSDMTIYINNCTLRLADGVYCNIFCNETAYYETLTVAQEQQNIKIIGLGNAMLDGGNHNGLTEATSETNGLPHIIYNTLVFMRNVNNLEIRDLKTKDSRWWTFTNIFCRNGLITNIDFDCRNNVPNQDGVDLRIGCNNFTISNLTGDTGDDSVALTALLHNFDTKWMVEGKDTDIHDVQIYNINTRVMGGHHIVRLLMQDGNKIYNIDIENIHDATIEEGGPSVAAAVKLGDTNYATVKQAVAGDMYNVSINHVITRAQMAIKVGTYAVTNEHFTYADVTNVAGNPVIGGYYTPPEPPVGEETLLNVAFQSITDADGWSSNAGAARYFGVAVDGQTAGYIIWVSRSERIQITTPNMLVTTNNYDEVHAEFEMWLNEKIGDPDLALNDLTLFYSADFGETWETASIPVSVVNTGKRAVYDYANQGDVYKVSTGNLAEILPGVAVTNFKIVPYAGIAPTGGPKLLNFQVLGDEA